MTGSELNERVREVHAAFEVDREAFEPPADPPAQDRALRLAREGIGPVVTVYLEGHTGGESVRFTEQELTDLHRALNGYLELYARCYGVEIHPDVTIRKAAELLIDTHNVNDVAQLLTHVPDRHGGVGPATDL